MLHAQSLTSSESLGSSRVSLSGQSLGYPITGRWGSPAAAAASPRSKYSARPAGTALMSLIHSRLESWWDRQHFFTHFAFLKRHQHIYGIQILQLMSYS